MGFCVNILLCSQLWESEIGLRDRSSSSYNSSNDGHRDISTAEGDGFHTKPAEGSKAIICVASGTIGPLLEQRAAIDGRREQKEDNG